MPAAIYLRSSKDRADISIAAQRTALKELALQRQHKIAAEFVDAVESGKDEDREGFQSLLRAIRNPRRGWDTLLVLDTSRIARRRHIAIVFEEVECKRHNVRVVYKSLPDSDPITEMLLKSILQAMDEWHSLTSRQKGLAGMRENVKQGFRAGGRAPMGYKLEAVETGAVRDGAAVTKSRLVLGPDADAVRSFLVQRAAGVPRARAGLPNISAGSQVGIEWNALTYAGHTVWNVHAENGSGRKRRPRAQWVINRGTHEALISDAQAEIILARLEGYSHSHSRNRDASYLLSGLLFSPEGLPFHGDRGAYRVKGRQVKAELVDRAVVESVLRDLQSSEFVLAITAAARAVRVQDNTGRMREELAALERRLEKLVGLIEQSEAPGPLIRQMEKLEADRSHTSNELAAAEQERTERIAASKITEHEVRRLLVERAARLDEADPEATRDVLNSLVSRINIAGTNLQVHYKFGRDKMASPRVAEPIPVVVTHKLKP